MTINSSRIRNLVSDCKTESDIIRVLRYHKIKYSFTTETGFLSIRIPYKKGIVRVFRVCSRSYPFVIRTEKRYRESLVSSVPMYIPIVYNYDN